MRGWKRVAVLATALVMTFAVTPSSEAIVGGTFDGGTHSNVAYFEAYDSSGDYLYYCTGTLVSPTVIVTAAHCTGGDPRLGAVASMKATLEAIPSQATPLAVSSWHPHPDYALPVKTGTRQFLDEQYDDIGVVILAEPVVGVVPATVVGAGQLTTLAKGSPMTVVGYGAEREFEPPRKPTFVYNVLRMTTTAGLKSLGSNLLILNGNPKNNLDGGGSCYGDSGGPVFSGALLVSVNSFGQTNCQNATGSVRLDTPVARAFLDDYIALPN